MVEAATGIIRTLAGSGLAGFSGDGGPATLAKLQGPSSVAIIGGFVYIADMGNQRIRRVPTAGGNIETIAGTGEFGYAINGGPAASAKLWGPRKLVVAPNGDLVFSDNGNKVVRSIRLGAGGPCASAAGPPPPAGELGAAAGGNLER
jgi:serine/threonine-protein kinase